MGTGTRPAHERGVYQNDRDFGKMVALHGTDIVRVPLAEAVGTLKIVPLERMTEAEVFFG